MARFQNPVASNQQGSGRREWAGDELVGDGSGAGMHGHKYIGIQVCRYVGGKKSGVRYQHLAFSSEQLEGLQRTARAGVSQTRGVKCLGGTWVKSARAPMAVADLIVTPSAVDRLK